MINEKFRIKLPVWSSFDSDSQNKIVLLFGKACRLFLDSNVSLVMKSEIITFLIHCFASLDHPVLQSEALRLVNIGILKHLENDHVRNVLFTQSPNLKEIWDRFNLKLNAIGMSFVE